MNFVQRIRKYILRFPIYFFLFFTSFLTIDPRRRFCLSSDYFNDFYYREHREQHGREVRLEK